MTGKHCRARSKKSGFLFRLRENREWKKRAYLERKPTAEEGETVIKGVSKRVIVVRPPDARIFEQAIFIIREDFALQPGLSEKDVLRQAKKAAGDYLSAGKKAPADRWRNLRAPIYALAGAAATALAWLAAHAAQLI